MAAQVQSDVDIDCSVTPGPGDQIGTTNAPIDPLLGPLVVDPAVKGKGYGRALKDAVIAEATVAGAVAVSSIVHRKNTAMISLNRQFGAVVEEIPDDRDHCRCLIGPLQN